MVRYLSLLSFTRQGMESIQDSPARASKFNAQIKAAGGRVVSMYWATGESDGALIFEAPDEQTATALLLQLAQQGNVRTRSMRVYDRQEFSAIMGSLK